MTRILHSTVNETLLKFSIGRAIASQPMRSGLALQRSQAVADRREAEGGLKRTSALKCRVRGGSIGRRTVVQ